jgi:hypothetical protein
MFILYNIFCINAVLARSKQLYILFCFVKLWAYKRASTLVDDINLIRDTVCAQIDYLKHNLPCFVGFL